MTHPTDDSLKPCPFCGRAPKTIERPDNIDGTEFFCAVFCHCGGYSACAHKAAIHITPGYAKAEAVKAWNARALLAEQAKDAAEDAPSDQVIELAGALEVRRILEAIKEVANLRPANDKIIFDAAWQLCCEEIFYRATGCRWHMDEDAERFSRAARAAEGKA